MAGPSRLSVKGLAMGRDTECHQLPGFNLHFLECSSRFGRKGTCVADRFSTQTNFLSKPLTSLLKARRTSTPAHAASGRRKSCGQRLASALAYVARTSIVSWRSSEMLSLESFELFMFKPIASEAFQTGAGCQNVLKVVVYGQQQQQQQEVDSRSIFSCSIRVPTPLIGEVGDRGKTC